jgi:16S rRNA (cytosine967-C5)-methyltransferase
MQNVQLAAAQIIKQVMVNGRNLNQVLEKEINGKTDWSASQRGAIQDLSYGTLRFYGQLKEVLELLLHNPLTDERVGYLLLVTLYQLQYSKAQQHVVVDQAVRAAQTIQPHVGGLVNAILRNFLRQQAELLKQAELSVEAKFNHPAWWIKELQSQYGGASEAILQAGNTHPPMTLRVNLSKTSMAKYRALLADQGIAAEQVGVAALHLAQPVNVDKVPEFFAGLVSVQDAGAQHAAPLLDVKFGMRVLDACAAPGGKTAHILETADVRLVAVDKDGKRLQRVVENLQRLELNARLLEGDAAQPNDWWDGQLFDRILADVPCSGSGVVRRHPDIKWLRRREDLAGFAAQQLAILQALWPTLKVGGRLLYATCSVFKQENEEVIAKFLATTKSVQRVAVTLPEGSTGQLVPNAQHDGFFYALLHKTA